jgi:hypothetical protein
MKTASPSISPREVGTKTMAIAILAKYKKSVRRYNPAMKESVS